MINMECHVLKSRNDRASNSRFLDVGEGEGSRKGL